MAKERNDMIAPSFTASFSSRTETGGRRMEPFKVYSEDGKHYIYKGTLVYKGLVLSRETTEIPAGVWRAGRRFYPVAAKVGGEWKIIIKYKD